jgi:hypothetical protein
MLARPRQEGTLPSLPVLDLPPDLSGSSPEPDLQLPQVLASLDQDLGSGNLVLEPRDDGSYGAAGSNLSTDGAWQVEVLLSEEAMMRVDVVAEAL